MTNIAHFIEDRFLGLSSGAVPLTPAQRDAVAAFAAQHEECSDTADELRQRDDRALIAAAYWVMVDYVRGEL